MLPWWRRGATHHPPLALIYRPKPARKVPVLLRLVAALLLLLRLVLLVLLSQTLQLP
jgi:hypothetical protein